MANMLANAPPTPVRQDSIREANDALRLSHWAILCHQDQLDQIILGETN